MALRMSEKFHVYVIGLKPEFAKTPRIGLEDTFLEDTRVENILFPDNKTPN